MRVVLLDTIWKQDLAQLLDRDFDVMIVDSRDAPRRDSALADADVLVSARFTAEMGLVAQRLRLLVCPAAGTELIDRAALPQGAKLVNGTGHEIPMAEYVMGALVSLRQRFRESDTALRRGEWRYGFYGGNRMLQELWGTNLGLCGFGGIGQEIAKRAAAFGMKCAAVTVHREKARPAATNLEFLGALSETADVDRLAAWSDELVVCCELSPLTRGLFDARRFALMKPGALFVNVARGPIAVEQDLYDALVAKRIAGAALDVWYQYPHEAGDVRPPSGLPFGELDNVLMTPHASGWTDAAKERRLKAIAQVINDFAKG
jgi:phosphoglycerate dehydrogenase-like enzyme